MARAATTTFVVSAVALLLAAVVPPALGQTSAQFPCIGDSCVPKTCVDGYKVRRERERERERASL